MNDIEGYVIYLVILAIVAIVHLVKKGFEKLSGGKDGKGVDLAKSVQAQIERYRDRVRERSGVGGLIGQVGPAEEAKPKPPPQPPAPPRAAPPLRPAAEVVAAATPVEPVVRKSFWKEDEARKMSAEAAAILTAAGPIRLTRRNLKQAVLMAEMLGPPVAERDDYRLF